MKTTLLLIFTAFVLMSADPPKEKFSYCYVTTVTTFKKAVFMVDYGNGETVTIQTDDGKNRMFNSVMDGLNYMGADGWKVIERDAVGREHGFLMMKKY